jgi:hypothetical protein
MMEMSEITLVVLKYTNKGVLVVWETTDTGSQRNKFSSPIAPILLLPTLT